MNKLLCCIFIAIITLSACDGSHRRYKKNADILKENKLLESFTEVIKFVPETYTEIHTDTILSNGFNIKIKYYSLEDDFVTETRKSKNDSVVEVYHKNFEALIQVSKNTIIINQSLINKNLFRSYKNDSFWNGAVMQFLWVDHEASNNDALHLNTSFCIPNTETCKDFVLKINKNGAIKVNEINRLSNSI